MIQKYFNVAAEKEAMLREIGAIELWPEWMPGVQTVNVLKSEGHRSVVDLVIKTVTTIQMTMELDRSQDSTIRFRQLKGWFKSYAGDYTVLPSPDGKGSTFRITLEVESGMLIPKGMVQNKLAATLDLLEQALKKRLAEHAAAVAPQPRGEARIASVPAAPRETPTPTRRRKLAHVFPTRRGVEVWIAGRPYALKALA
jgi:ribosome-associated toxin RatA of RatAB toxin-antitoxin module